MPNDTKLTLVIPESLSCHLPSNSSSSSSSSVFYPNLSAGHLSTHALASGPNLDETTGRNLDKCTDETNNSLLPEGSLPPSPPFFPFGCYYNSPSRSNNFISGSEAYEEENLCWWSLTGLVERRALCVPFIFHSAHPLRVPLDLSSCKMCRVGGSGRSPRVRPRAASISPPPPPPRRGAPPPPAPGV